MATAGKSPSNLRKGTAKKVNETTVSVNLAGIEGRRTRRTHIPEGNYRAKVTDAKAETAKSGNDMITWTLEIIDHPKYAGVPFWERTVLTPEALWKLRSVLEALGVKVKDSTMNIPLPKLIGRTCGIEVVDGEYDGKTVSEINDIFHERLLEEEDEEEDEEEYEEEDDEVDEEEDEEGDEEEEEDEEDWEDIDLDEVEL